MLIYDKDTSNFSIVAKDTGDFIFSSKNYLFDEGDVIYFTVNSDYELEGEPLLQKVVNNFINHKAFFHLTSEDTNLPVGVYYYDIEVNTADGRVDTVIRSKFKVLGGVKY